MRAARTTSSMACVDCCAPAPRRAGRRAWRPPAGGCCSSTARPSGPGRPSQSRSDSWPAAVSTTSGALPRVDSRWAWLEQRRHGGGFVHGVLPAAGAAGERLVLARRRLGQGGPGGRREQPPDAEAGDAGQQGDRAGRAGVGRAGGGPVGAGGVEQDHPGDLLGVAGGVGHRVVAADGVPDQHVRAVLAGAAQQGVQIGGGGHPVLRSDASSLHPCPARS